MCVCVRVYMCIYVLEWLNVCVCVHFVCVCLYSTVLLCSAYHTAGGSTVDSQETRADLKKRRNPIQETWYTHIHVDL